MAKAKVSTDKPKKSAAKKGIKPSSKLKKNVAPDGKKPDGNPTAPVKKGALGAGKGK